MIKNSIHLLFVMCLALLLINCGNRSEHDDLKQYVKKIKSRTASQIEPVPVIEKQQGFSYPEQKRRNPFSPSAKKTESTDLPDRNRPKQILENYDLSTLKMVGTLKKEQATWAIISAPDGNFYRISVGKYLGKHDGKVVEITDDTVLLEEVYKESGGWRRRTQKINLIEGG